MGFPPFFRSIGCLIFWLLAKVLCRNFFSRRRSDEERPEGDEQEERDGDHEGGEDGEEVIKSCFPLIVVL